MLLMLSVVKLLVHCSTVAFIPKKKRLKCVSTCPDMLEGETWVEIITRSV